MALQIRRGTDTERLTVTPLPGEPVFTTDTKRLFIGDGTTPGGVSLSEQAQDAVDSLVSGAHVGITFVYNDAGNSLTATVTPIGLNDLTDTSTSGLANDQVLKYADGLGWINGFIGIDSLVDVSIVNPITGTVLTYDGLNWVNGRITIDSLLDVQLGSGWNNNDVLKFDNGMWTNGTLPLDALSDVQVSGAASGQFLKFNGTQWVSSSIDAGQAAGTLTDLTDVTVTSPQAGDVLSFDGAQWINNALNLDELADVSAATPADGNILVYQSGSWTATANASLQNLADDTAPTLGGDLSIGLHNITGSGYINILGDVTSPTFNGTLSGNVKAADTTIMVDVNNKNVNATNVNATRATLGSTTVGGDIKLYSAGDSFSEYFGIVGGATVPWVEVSSSRGTHATPTAVNAGDYLSGLVLKAHNGTTHKVTVALGGLVDGAIGGAGDVPGTFAVATTSADGAQNFLTFNSIGVLTAPVIKAPSYATGSLPGSPEEGWMAFDSTTKQFKGWNGTAWVVLG